MGAEKSKHCLVDIPELVVGEVQADIVTGREHASRQLLCTS
jgi:hypothetical protein